MGYLSFQELHAGLPFRKEECMWQTTCYVWLGTEWCLTEVRSEKCSHLILDETLYNLDILHAAAEFPSSHTIGSLSQDLCSGPTCNLLMPSKSLGFLRARRRLAYTVSR